MNNYHSYKSIPSLAGICTMKEAMKPGLSIEECVTRLKRYHYALKRLHQIFNNRITAEPIYELKMGFSLHAHYCAEHVATLRKRVGEMREPPLGLEETPHEALEVFFDEILSAPTTEELLLGIYEKALPAVKAALERHVAGTNPLADHPSIRVCRFALLEIEDMLRFGTQSIASLVNDPVRARAKNWLRMLDDCVAAAGGLDGIKAPVSDPTQSAATNAQGANSETGALMPAPARHYSARPYKFDGVPRRDNRFPDPYNMGVNAEVFLYDPDFPPEPKTLMMFYKRLREIDVPEMMASIIAETPDKPWDYIAI